MTRRRVFALLGLVLLWWFFLAPVLADHHWWNPLSTRLVGTAIIAALAGLVVGLGRQAGVMALAIASTILGNRKARWGIATTIALVFLITKREDLPWWWSDFRDFLSDAAWEVWFWLEPILWGEAWDRLAIVVCGIALLIWTIRKAGGIRPAVGTLVNTVKTVPAIGALLAFRKWWQMEVGYRVATAVLGVLAVIYTVTWSPLNLTVVIIIMTVVIYRGWPRENPLDPPPVAPFDLPVLRAIGVIDAAVLFLAALGILTAGITWFLVSGYQFWVLVATLAFAQLVFLLYVDRRPGVVQAWTRVRVVPQDHQLIIDRARGGVGEISIAPLRLGPFRLKERKSIWDNLLRIFGYYLFEVEPVGFKPEEGEPETLEFYVQCAHFRFRGRDRVWRGPRALINYVASL